MARIVRWQPFPDMLALREAMDRAFEDRLFRPQMPFGPWAEDTLPVDMYETDESVVVKTAVPGVNAEEIEVSVTGDTLTIKAESKEEEEIQSESYLRRERRIGSVCRSVTLPGGLESEKAVADYSDGVLTLTFPKAEEVKPKSITVTAK